MEENKIALRPSYWASVSGGKDSLYMLKLILSNPEEYPLNGVVHFEMENDYPFIRDVVNYMESECKKYGIAFVRIKPRKKWMDEYIKKGFPTRERRWCNGLKKDASKQLEEWMRTFGNYVVYYIGYCADEKKRFRLEKVVSGKEIYPLADYEIQEDEILKWARKQPIFNNYYKTNRRCGCMWCPMASRINQAYLYKYYPEEFYYMTVLAERTEKDVEKKTGESFSVWDGNSKYNTEYMERIVKTKWLKILNEKEKENESND